MISDVVDALPARLQRRRWSDDVSAAYHRRTDLLGPLWTAASKAPERRHEAGAGILSRLVRLREPEGLGEIERQREMAVGPAGTINDANVRPQNNGGVLPKQVEQFKEAIRSTTPNDASGTQGSNGEHAAEHSQDTSKSFAILLATR